MCRWIPATRESGSRICCATVSRCCCWSTQWGGLSSPMSRCWRPCSTWRPMRRAGQPVPPKTRSAPRWACIPGIWPTLSTRRTRLPNRKAWQWSTVARRTSSSGTREAKNCRCHARRCSLLRSAWRSHSRKFSARCVVEARWCSCRKRLKEIRDDWPAFWAGSPSEERFYRP